MGTLLDQSNLASDSAFQRRVAAALVHTALQIQAESTNEIQTLTFGGTVTGGTFTLTYAGQVTAAIPWNASAGAVHAALGALTNVGMANVAVAGGPGPGTPHIVTFVGTLAGSPQPLLVVASSLTGTAPTLTPTRTTAGAVGNVTHAQRAALASKVLANPTGYAQLMALGVADSATVQGDFNLTTLQPSATEAQVATDVNNQCSAIWNAYT